MRPLKRPRPTMLSAYRPMLLSLFESLQRLAADPYGRAREAQAIQNTLIEQITAADDARAGKEICE